MLIGNVTDPPPKAGEEPPPLSSALSRLWWRMRSKCREYSRHKLRENVSTRASQIVSRRPSFSLHDFSRRRKGSGAHRRPADLDRSDDTHKTAPDKRYVTRLDSDVGSCPDREADIDAWQALLTSLLPCEADSRGRGAARDTDVHQDIIAVTAGQRDEAAIGHRAGDRHWLKFQAVLPNMSQSRYGCSHFGVLDTRARRGLEDRDDDVVFMCTARAPPCIVASG